MRDRITPPARRFWREVTVAATPEGWQVQLDGRPVMTPARRPLMVPVQALAEAVAQEWRCLGDEIQPGTMIQTSLVNTWLDRVVPERAAIIQAVLAYGASDLLCYEAAGPDPLLERQRAAWAPWRALALEIWGAELTVTQGVMPVTQSPACLAALARVVRALDDPRLTALQVAVPVLGSLVLSLALVEQRLDAATASALAGLDEAWQSEQWGEPPEKQAERLGRAQVIAAVERFLLLLSPPPGEPAA